MLIKISNFLEFTRIKIIRNERFTRIKIIRNERINQLIEKQLFGIYPNKIISLMLDLTFWA